MIRPKIDQIATQKVLEIGGRLQSGAMNDLPALLTLAIKIAHEAGDILRAGRENGFGALSTKSSATDIVTEIDHASEEHIVSMIRAQRPDDSILGEEGTSIDGTTGVRWVIDPLDGTVNFTYGIPAFAVSIGIEIDGVPTVGAVYNPATDELFHAATGMGAFRNDEPIHVRPETPLTHALVATGFSYLKDIRHQQATLLLDVLPEVRDLRRLGAAAYDMSLVASGALDAYFEWGIKPWDVVAGTVILREAGGVVTDFAGTAGYQGVLAASCALVHEGLLTHTKTFNPLA